MRTIGDTTQWHMDNGDYTVRLNYNLNNDSIVFDLGGYKGWFTEQINNKYGSQIYVFEPIVTLSEEMVTNFLELDNVNVYSMAVSDKNGHDVIYFNDDASSTHVQLGKPLDIECITLDKVMSDNNIEKIDLIKINIEGEEYSLLEHMIKNNLIEKCVNIQVQFHVIVENYEARYTNIRHELEKTHHLTYRYPFVWENWEKD